MIVIRINSGSLRNDLDAIARLIDQPDEMLIESATHVERVLRGHFAERDKTGNKLGGARSHFLSQIGNSVAAQPPDGRSVDIQIGDLRFGQKLYGGTIRAKTPWKGSGFLLLTIPVHPAAYGRRARELKQDGLKLVFLGKSTGGVIAAYGEGQMQVLYACVPSVTQQPDPDALPPGDDMEDAARKGAEDYLRFAIEKSNSPNA